MEWNEKSDISDFERLANNERKPKDFFDHIREEGVRPSVSLAEEHDLVFHKQRGGSRE